MILESTPDKWFAIGKVKNRVGGVDYFMVIRCHWKTMNIYNPLKDEFVTGHPRLILRLKTGWII